MTNRLLAIKLASTSFLSARLPFIGSCIRRQCRYRYLNESATTLLMWHARVRTARGELTSSVATRVAYEIYIRAL